MNEHGLTISESTWGGRPELEGTGTIDYGSLIYITLQRAKTADAALDTMISLVDRYGYASSGESFTIADADHAWIMEMIGKGKAGKGPCGWPAVCPTIASRVMPIMPASISFRSTTPPTRPAIRPM